MLRREDACERLCCVDELILERWRWCMAGLVRTLLNAYELLAVFDMCIAFVQYLHDI